MTIRVSDRRHLSPLMDALRRAGCSVSRVEADSCRVTAEEADDAQHVYLEVRFFARAWAVGNGAQVQVDAS